MTSQKPKKAKKKNSVTETRKHQLLKNHNQKKKLKKLKRKKLEMLLAAQDKPVDANAKIDPWYGNLPPRTRIPKGIQPRLPKGICSRWLRTRMRTTKIPPRTRWTTNVRPTPTATLPTNSSLRRTKKIWTRTIRPRPTKRLQPRKGFHARKEDDVKTFS